MKIQHLRFLTAVVDYGGVIRAAERLHLSQPTISVGLKALERELGKPLFDRSAQPNRPLRLTASGRRFYQNALEILRQCDAARADLLDTPNKELRVRLGVIDTLPQEAIIKILRILKKKVPEVKVEIWEGSIDRVSNWLSQERIDVAWTNVNELIPNARSLWREPLVAVVAPSHSFAKNRTGSVAIRDLANQSFIHRSRCELDAIGRAQLKMASVKLRVVGRADSEELAFRLILNEKGFTLAPRSLVPGYLVAVPISDLTVTRSIGLQWNEKLDMTLLGIVIDAAEQAAETLSTSTN